MLRTVTKLTLTWRFALAAGALVALQVAVLNWLGQPWIAQSGRILLWAGDPLSPDTSQQISDWYSFSHLIHGFAFYGLLHLLFPRLPVMTRLLIAIGAEVAWEIAENLPMVIQHYRKQALAAGYVGDSILNSVLDTVMMALGFLLAKRAPVGIVVALAIAFELFTGLMIRDGLILNIIGFAWTPDFIAHWQSAAGKP
ncbi:MAG: DUF2585 family protein [Pseudomonadota bacterium]